MNRSSSTRSPNSSRSATKASGSSRCQAGLDRAGRFEPSSRRIRAVLAFGRLEFFSRRWFKVGWDVDRDETVRLLTDAWCSLLVDELLVDELLVDEDAAAR